MRVERTGFWVELVTGAGLGLIIAGAAVAQSLPATVVTSPPSSAQFWQDVAARQAVAARFASHPEVFDFYAARDFAPIWTGEGPEFELRRAALLAALEASGDHGLPRASYDIAGLRAGFATGADIATELRAALTYLDYAQDISAGVLEPATLAEDIHKTTPRQSSEALLSGFASADNPLIYLSNLTPKHPQYARLQRAMFDLARVVEAGGWGAPVVAERLELGDQGPAVAALIARLQAMGYLAEEPSSASVTLSTANDAQTATEAPAPALFDDRLVGAVMRFQADNGLTQDGIVGANTLAAINVDAETRLKDVILAMERQRWMNFDRGERHVLVNIPDFHATVVDQDVVTFSTRSVVGHPDPRRHTPEFSDVMEYMVINPSWTVPRSITTREYLPQLQEDPTAQSQLELWSGGQVVDRAQVDFTQYTASTFPYTLRQAPSTSNALGLVKFMFPNPWNIYLHDTPAKNLFARETRAYSHGCVRLQDPFDFAYHLLAPQVDNPEAYFARILATGRETTVQLETPIPVHLVYWTSFVDPDGRLQHRADIYGRNADLWQALEAAGVSVAAISS
ncbi:L,D-transpeptidase family protein [Roseovarius sp. 10]|uniref:L,D-transpeptidase family protein n=1 Tax=Roseovarius sp. 10 TaxID=3080563 RepID=UPI002955B6BA|nr:L,D-transpeptidase family protein [Roseovarius sp. 10]MDV7200280.1 L,D-transpeptidase family protein [Roseovarius sp. 10]